MLYQGQSRVELKMLDPAKYQDLTDQMRRLQLEAERVNSPRMRLERLERLGGAHDVFATAEVGEQLRAARAKLDVSLEEALLTAGELGLRADPQQFSTVPRDDLTRSMNVSALQRRTLFIQSNERELPIGQPADLARVRRHRADLLVPLIGGKVDQLTPIRVAQLVDLWEKQNQGEGLGLAKEIQVLDARITLSQRFFAEARQVEVISRLQAALHQAQTHVAEADNQLERLRSSYRDRYETDWLRVPDGPIDTAVLVELHRKAKAYLEYDITIRNAQSDLWQMREVAWHRDKWVAKASALQQLAGRMDTLAGERLRVQSALDAAESAIITSPLTREHEMGEFRWLTQRSGRTDLLKALVVDPVNAMRLELRELLENSITVDTAAAQLARIDAAMVEGFRTKLDAVLVEDRPRRMSSAMSLRTPTPAGICGATS